MYENYLFVLYCFCCRLVFLMLTYVVQAFHTCLEYKIRTFIKALKGKQTLDFTTATKYSWIPVNPDHSKLLTLMSIGFLLNSKDDAIVWRGPRKNGDSFKY